MSVMDMLAEIFEEVSPDFSPDSPTVSPKQKPHQAKVLAPLAPLARRSGEPNPGHPSPCQGCPALGVADELVFGCVKGLPPESPWAEEWRPIPAGMTRCPESPRMAQGYGCGNCGKNLYHENPDGWKCSGCGKVFLVIGGSNGPRFH